VREGSVGILLGLGASLAVIRSNSRADAIAKEGTQEDAVMIRVGHNDEEAGQR